MLAGNPANAYSSTRGRHLVASAFQVLETDLVPTLRSCGSRLVRVGFGVDPDIQITTIG
jgi:hypothetical protein